MRKGDYKTFHKNEIDFFSEIEENVIISIEILRHSFFKCLYSTKDDSTFQNFISELKNDRIATIHFKKSMIFKEYLSICTNQNILLIPSSSRFQINKIFQQIQKCEIYCIDDKDRDRLTKYENHNLLQNFAPDEKVEDIRQTLHARINERFEIFNTVKSSMINYYITYMSFFYLVQEVASSYYDLTQQPSPTQQQYSSTFNSESESLSTIKISTFCESLHKTRTFSNTSLLHFDIFKEFKENEIVDIEILPLTIFRCLFSTQDDTAFKKFLSEIKNDSFCVFHFKKSLMYGEYLSVCTDHRVLLLPYESRCQIDELFQRINGRQAVLISEKDRDKLSTFEGSKLLKKCSLDGDESLRALRQNLNARINERFEVVNAAQSFMICSRATSFAAFLYLTEEVISAYYDLRPTPDGGLAQLSELYQKFEQKIRSLHQSLFHNSSLFTSVDSTLSEVSNLLQFSSVYQKNKQLVDCIKSYQKVNMSLKKTEDSVNDFIRQKRSVLPSLSRSTQERNEEVEENLFDDDHFEFKKLKYDVESRQKNLHQLNQQIKQAASNEAAHRRKAVSEPNPRQPDRRLSPRALRNRAKYLLKKVDEGDVMSMYSLGACYSRGDGVPQDQWKSFYYYSLAAEKGDKDAQYMAATCCSYGKGTAVDKGRAFKLYSLSAEQGNPKAQFAVGHFYEYGQGGVEPDHEKAKEWYRKAAEQGHAAAKKLIDVYVSE